MTTVTVKRAEGFITGVKVSGHSGYAPEGEDIVCAAVTSAVRFLDCILSDETGLDTCSSVGRDSVRITSGGSANAQPVLSAFVRYMRELSKEYPDNIRVMEEN